jgi:hypothetical protein
MNRTLPHLSLALAGLILSGCLSPADRSPGGRAEIAPRPQGIEGNWGSVGGPVAYTASFQSGTFRSTEDATGAPLASGTYRNAGPGQVAINFRSATSGQETAVNCNQMSADRLSCVNSGGTRFDLTRRA